ncbi:MAG: DUF3429 domain-containing protein [Xanthomonadales bacterium]|nr:DUF3429 domain-containing protein [Xanthomonadales bacterium]
MHSKDEAPVSSAVLGYGGVIPFLGLALNYWLGGPLFPGFALQAFLVYSAVILSFLGGIRWGAAVNLGKTRTRELALSVLPSLFAAGTLLLPSPLWSVWALLAGFLLVGLGDVLVPGPSVPRWMIRLRIRLTIAVVVCHLLMLAAFYR